QGGGHPAASRGAACPARGAGGRGGRSPRGWWLLAAACLALPGIAAAGATLADCRAITTDSERLACYDAVAAGMMAAEDLFGHDSVRSAAELRIAAGIDELEASSATVVALDTDPRGRLLLALDNGQAWEQIDSGRLAIQPGTRVRIRRAALGSYLLGIDGGTGSMRVRRRH
ncbi:MAG: hypothetical protein H3C57_07150, partial [Gammaproteobacteria bacterium]|nr:hypothetical protein [Gammaproteobacteria bacterium]